MEKTYSFQKLADFVWGFAIKHRILRVGDQVVVGLSAGVDSRLLLELANYWRHKGLIKSVRALHFNHRLRQESQQEEDFVKKLAAFLEVEIVCGHKEGSLTSELALKKARYQFFDQSRAGPELLLLAHHLDDSFEWSLRQSARSSLARSILGMPAKNGYVRRPLMCVSKAQIEYAADQFDLQYCHDKSNDSLLYERNYIRHEIVPKLKSLSAGCLKNYVHRSNHLAHILGVHLAGSAALELNVDVRRQPFLHYILTWEQKELGGSAKSVILEILMSLSRKKRGMWRDQVEKLMNSSRHKKWAGPFSFSGGVQAIVCPKRILFYHQNHEEQLRQVLSANHFNGERAWLFSYSSIDFNNYPKVPRGHILSLWSEIVPGQCLVTHDQLQTLSLVKRRAFCPRPIF